jgi:ATP-dependent Clp protease ATP-binding subunit ClpA
MSVQCSVSRVFLFSRFPVSRVVSFSNSLSARNTQRIATAYRYAPFALAPRVPSLLPFSRLFSSSPPSKPWVDPSAVPKGEHLKKYCIDLTDLAKKDKLDPVIGREEEMRRTIEILCRRTKNNPAIIGEPGVGKRTLITHNNKRKQTAEN